MVKVTPQSRERELSSKFIHLEIGSLIILELVFNEEEFSMHSELTVTELSKEEKRGKAQFNNVREAAKRQTFNDYTRYKGTTVNFHYCDICDIDIKD